MMKPTSISIPTMRKSCVNTKNSFPDVGKMTKAAHVSKDAILFKPSGNDALREDAICT